VKFDYRRDVPFRTNGFGLTKREWRRRESNPRKVPVVSSRRLLRRLIGSATGHEAHEQAGNRDSSQGISGDSSQGSAGLLTPAEPIGERHVRKSGVDANGETYRSQEDADLGAKQHAEQDPDGWRRGDEDETTAPRSAA